jgi:hypothetical protein
MDAEKLTNQKNYIMKNKKIAEIEIEVNKEFQEDQRMIVR